MPHIGSITAARDEAFARFEATEPADADFGDWLATENRALFEAVAEMEEGDRRTTTAKLIELVRPFVGAKLNPPRDAKGYIQPQTLAIDILHVCNSINADVRAVTAEGIEKVWGGFAEFIPWAEVQRVTIRSLDADGNTTAASAYQHDRLPALVVGHGAYVRGLAA